MGAAKGRCAGCGFTASLSAAERHVMGCSDYATAFRADPSLLSPGPEHERWVASGEAAADREARDAAAWAARAEKQARFREAEAARWGTSATSQSPGTSGENDPREEAAG